MSAINRRQFFGFFATTVASLAISRKFAKNPPKNEAFSANASQYRATNRRIHTGSTRLVFVGTPTNATVLSYRSSRASVASIVLDDYSKGFKPL